MKNPNWSREELILVLDLYFQLDYGQMDGKRPEVIQLSKDLKQLGLHSIVADEESFRSTGSVSLKLANIKRLDQNFKGLGMKDGGKLEAEIWKEFHKHRDTLKREADLIRQLYLSEKTTQPSMASESSSNYKSDLLFKLHKNLEMNPLYIKWKTESVLASSKILRCEVCGFDSIACYGELGRDIMEIHYKKELESPTLEISTTEDFMIVCGNCHKVLDKNFNILTFKDLRKIIHKR